MQLFAPLIAADFFDILKAIVPILFFVFWVVSSVFGGAKERAEAQKKRAQQRELARQRAGEQQQRPKNEDITSEIEDFLKRAAERRENKGQRPRPPETVQTKPQRRPPEKRREAKSESPKREPLTQMSRDNRREQAPAPAERPRARPAAAPSLPPVRSDERRSIEHLHDTSVGHADEAMAAHLNQVFGHQVGSLGGSNLTPATATFSPASDSPAATPVVAPIGLAALLADQRNLQNAIVLNEIFQRPEHRWS